MPISFSAETWSTGTMLPARSARGNAFSSSSLADLARLEVLLEEGVVHLDDAVGHLLAVLVGRGLQVASGISSPKRSTTCETPAP